MPGLQLHCSPAHSSLQLSSMRRKTQVYIRAQASSGAAIPGTAGPAKNKKQNTLRVFESEQLSTKPLPPGPNFMWPIIGETIEANSKGYLRFGIERMLKYGPIFRTSLFGFEFYMVCSPDAFKTIMAEDTKIVVFQVAGAFAKAQSEFTVNVLTNKDGQRLPFRRTMLPAVTQEAMASYVPKINEISLAAIQEMAAVPEFAIGVEARKWGMEFANNLLAGLKTKGEEDKAALREDLATWFGGMVAFDIDLPGSTLRKAIDARLRLQERVKACVREQLDEMLAEKPSLDANGMKIRKNMMAYIIDGRRAEGLPVDEDFLADLGLGVLQAGTDTSSAGFAGLFAILAQRPDLVEQIREEQRSLIRDHGPEITKAGLDSCKILDAVVKEALRIKPLAVVHFRNTLKEFEIDGYRIPKGSQLAFNTPLMQGIEMEPGFEQRARAAWEAGQGIVLPEGSDGQSVAQNFSIDKWFVEDPAKRPSLMTFGYGPHVCLGIGLYTLEAKGLLAQLIRRYDLELASSRSFNWLEMPITKPEDDLKLKLIPLAQPLV